MQGCVPHLQVAAPEIAMIKMVVPRVAQEVVDNAIQVGQLLSAVDTYLVKVNACLHKWFSLT